MPETNETGSILRPIDLRGILHYVPMFRGHTFVIALDGSVVAGENLPDLLTDVAVLHSLQIKIVLVHGVGHQLRELAAVRGHSIEDPYGIGPTDDHALALAIEASALATHHLQSSLTRAGLRFEMSNAIRATERGIIKSINQLNTGRVEKIDVGYLMSRIEAGVIPIISPIAYNRDGKAMRLNSDATAVDLAVQLEASKLLFLSRFPGLETTEGGIQKSIPLPELEGRLRDHPEGWHPSLKSKLSGALEATRNGVSRVHILDGNLYGALLTEIFEKEGVGTMIHADDYQQIRKAIPKDLQAIASLARQGAESDTLRLRSWKSIRDELDHYFVYEIDDFLLSCASLRLFEDTRQAELGTVFVHPVYRGRGVGRKMVAYAERKARAAGVETLFALSTQNFSFFEKSGGFVPADLSELPAERQEHYLHEKRAGQILKKNL